MKVKYFPYQAHCFASGGFENLMNSTFEAIRSRGISVSKIDLWDTEADFDIAHFWGLGSPNYNNIIWAKKSDKKVIVTCILPAYSTTKQKFRYFVSNFLGKQKAIKNIFRSIDIVVVTNQRSRLVAIRYYKVPSEKIFIIPNTLLSSYYQKYGKLSFRTIKLKKYVLTIGNVCKRKNQIRLALACLKVNVGLLIVGPILSGEEEYGAELNDIVNKSDQMIWLDSMKRDSLELISAYKNSLLYALPSFEEEQPTSAQEAGLLGKPLLLGDLSYARQKYFKNSYLVNPSSVCSIANGIAAILKNPSNFIPPFEVYSECKEENVASEYISLYSTLFDGSK